MTRELGFYSKHGILSGSDDKEVVGGSNGCSVEMLAV